MRKSISALFRRLIDKNDPTSIKGFTMVMILLHYILTSFIILFFVFYLIFHTVKGTVDINLLNMLGEITKYDFYAICTTILGISTENIAGIMANKSKEVISDITTRDLKTEKPKEEPLIENEQE